uniref:RING finger protein 141 n=1 Tax=Schistocephalus solidus TaxID=70667 RepID=A0A0X3PPE9_SCHSO
MAISALQVLVSASDSTSQASELRGQGSRQMGHCWRLLHSVSDGQLPAEEILGRRSSDLTHAFIQLRQKECAQGRMEFGGASQHIMQRSSELTVWATGMLLSWGMNCRCLISTYKTLNCLRVKIRDMSNSPVLEFLMLQIMFKIKRHKGFEGFIGANANSTSVCSGTYKFLSLINSENSE